MRAECICGHSEDMHDSMTGACMDMITTNKASSQGVQVFACACKEYKQVVKP